MKFLILLVKAFPKAVSDLRIVMIHVAKIGQFIANADQLCIAPRTFQLIDRLLFPNQPGAFRRVIPAFIFTLRCHQVCNPGSELPFNLFPGDRSVLNRIMQNSGRKDFFILGQRRRNAQHLNRMKNKRSAFSFPDCTLVRPGCKNNRFFDESQGT